MSRCCCMFLSPIRSCSHIAASYRPCSLIFLLHAAILLTTLCTSFGTDDQHIIRDEDFLQTQPSHHDIKPVMTDADASKRCQLDLIWPAADDIVLLATDSLSITAYFKLFGNCSEFLHVDPPEINRLRFWLVTRDELSGRRLSVAQHAHPLECLPLDEDPTPHHIRLMRSPLLVNSEHHPSGWVTSGRHSPSDSFSVWHLSLVYDKKAINIAGAHDLPSLYMTFDFYLVADAAVPVSRSRQPDASLRFSRLGEPSSHFFAVVPRYTSIPGYICLSACGRRCEQHTQSKRNEGAHSLRTTESPVCSRAPKSITSNLSGPGFTLQGHRSSRIPDESSSGIPDETLVGGVVDACGSKKGCFRDIASVSYVSIGGESDSPSHELSVFGPGRHRLLSLIAAVLQDGAAFIFLKTVRLRIDHSLVLKMIAEHQLDSSRAVIGFRHRRLQNSSQEAADEALFLPKSQFGSIHQGILLSRAAAELMVMIANDEAALHSDATLPAPCSEFLIFSDAWLCWCAAQSGVFAIDMHFSSNSLDEDAETGSCLESSPLYLNLAFIYFQQLLSSSHSSLPPFTQRSTLGFRYFMQTLIFHLVNSPHILHIPDNEERGETLFWDRCASQLLVDYMCASSASAGHLDLHPVVRHLRTNLASVPSRSALVAHLRAAIVSDDIEGRHRLVDAIPTVRQRLRMSVSATRALGCSVLKSNTFSLSSGDDLLTGTSGNSSSSLELHAISPAVLLMKHGRQVSRALYLSTHEEWSHVFGYNPLFTKVASLAYTAPEFSVDDWHSLCLLAVSLSQGITVPEFEANSREFIACDAFASAVWLRTYASGMPQSLGLPCVEAGDRRYTGSAHHHTQHLKQCQSDARGMSGEVDEDPWNLRQLAEEVQLLLLERWELQQSWFEASLHLHSKLILRADEFAETLQWNICRGTVASVTAVVEHNISAAAFMRSLSVPIHDPENKLHLHTVPGIYQFDTGFKLAAERFEGKVVIMMSADMLLGDEQRWQNLTPNGTSAFFSDGTMRMLALSRLELDDEIEPCCTLKVVLTCHDAFVFRSPLHSGVRLDLFNYQQNIWRGEQYALGLLRSGGYDLYNPCFSLPVFHNHISGQRPNQNENSIFEIRRVENAFFASTCQPQLDVTEQCEEMFNCIDFVEFDEAHLCAK